MSKPFPRGLQPGHIEHRFATASPESYNAEAHSVIATLSTGAPVRRNYGVERLLIDKSSVDLSRIASGGVPLLDAHNATTIKSTLGRVSDAWIANGKLMGVLVFAATPEGKAAEAMVQRREISSVSIGYSVQQWRVVDANGNEIDPLDADDDAIFEAVRFTLVELSLVATPADPAATIRSLGSGEPKQVTDARARMLARQRMHDRAEVARIRSRMRERQRALNRGEYDPESQSRAYRTRII